MADRLFDAELYVFAADFYAQAMAADVEQQFVPSNRFRKEETKRIHSTVSKSNSNRDSWKSICTFIHFSVSNEKATYQRSKPQTSEDSEAWKKNREKQQHQATK
ncbi:hypothetical protein L916_14041 [Phytophthora nicotianae]|uniref:Uncharacterized protein n=1 Tax=Phytophthora nicotianae TaxID=4792 RepID=W2IH69_PHYNI|nr:hypothetical protein L916_14041 [Phytophthora nicotianae]